MIERLRQWPADTLARLRRSASGPAAVRVLAGVSAFLAMLVSLPADVSLGGRPWLPLLAAAVLAGCVALYPRGRWAGAVALVSAGAWVVASVGYGDVLMPHPWRILGAIEGATGIIMLGWSTAFLVSLLTQLNLLRHDWLTGEDQPRLGGKQRERVDHAGKE